MSLRTCVFALVLVGVAGIAQAGAVFRIEAEDLSAGGKVEITEIKIDGNRMRTDTHGEDPTSMIFLGETDEMYVIDHAEKTYILMDKKTIEALGARMSEAMQQMEAALAQVPPEQREMMERMMKERMGGMSSTPPAEPVVRSLGENDSVNGVSCAWKEVTREGVVDFKACVGNPADIAGGNEMQAMALEMKEFVSALMDAMSSMTNSNMFGSVLAENPANTMEDLGGFPLISEDFDEGKLSRRSRVQSADEVSVADEEFVPPSGYKKQDFGGMTR
ncbi:MAG: hypothetical protein ACRD1X_09655 [Vicinamibacteria bacterium]